MIRCYRIDGYKTARDGNQITTLDSTQSAFGADNVYHYPEVERLIRNLLSQENLLERNIVSISACLATDRDPGSWYFWLFVRDMRD
jgi:hypothetical protein